MRQPAINSLVSVNGRSVIMTPLLEFAMTFAPGDAVHVAGLGKGVVREVRKGGRYLIDLRGHAIVAVEDQLTALPGREERGTRADVPHEAESRSSSTRSYAATSLDLHGRTAEEAIAALDAFLNDALLAGHAEVQVIHGRSGGRLKAAVHARLKHCRRCAHSDSIPQTPARRS
jgi:DNA mismatch repair protein MutS2